MMLGSLLVHILRHNVSSDEEVSSRLIVMAQEYNAKAEALETDTRSPLAAVRQDASSVRQRDET
jgi:LysM repeat protein